MAASQHFQRCMTALLLLGVLLASAAGAARSTSAGATDPVPAQAQHHRSYYGGHGSHHPVLVNPTDPKPPSPPPPPCTGTACQRMSDLLPQLAFKVPGQKVQCTCADFKAGVCFAPGCFPCDKACFSFDPNLANVPGPLGTGLLCSFGCSPCCQTANDPNLAPNSTCTLQTGC